MELRIKLFTVLRERAGTEEIRMEWIQGMTYRDVMNRLKKDYRDMEPLLDRSFVAVNGRYPERDTLLMPEDEVAVLPPVSGG